MEEGKEGKEEAVAGSGIVLHDFSGRLGEQRVHFHAMRLRDSLFLWVGAAPALSSLAVAMCSPRDGVPVSTSLLGDPSDTASACLAQRLGAGKVSVDITSTSSLSLSHPGTVVSNMAQRVYKLMPDSSSSSLDVGLCSFHHFKAPGRPKNRYLSATIFKTQTAISPYS
ncbi:proteasome assembly chaperone 4 isoform 1-T1 [Mergus octosetaceus]